MFVITVLIWVGFGMFLNAHRAFQKDQFISAMNDIGASAVTFRMKPRSLGGGGGEYIGFIIPGHLAAIGAEHPAVVLGTQERLSLKPRVCVILCSTQRATRPPELHEVILNHADGLDWETLCKCDVVYAASKSDLVKRRGTVTTERRRAIAERIIRSLGLAGL